MGQRCEALTVPLASQAYPIYIGEGLLSDAERWAQCLAPYQQVAILTNPIVATHYETLLTDTLATFQPAVFQMPEGEAHKTLATVEALITGLLEKGFHRDACVIALGGGRCRRYCGICRGVLPARH